MYLAFLMGLQKTIFFFNFSTHQKIFTNVERIHKKYPRDSCMQTNNEHLVKTKHCVCFVGIPLACLGLFSWRNKNFCWLSEFIHIYFFGRLPAIKPHVQSLCAKPKKAWECQVNGQAFHGTTKIPICIFPEITTQSYLSFRKKVTTPFVEAQHTREILSRRKMLDGPEAQKAMEPNVRNNG